MYQPLNPTLLEIRLLVLHPGVEHSQIKGTVYVSTLNSVDPPGTGKTSLRKETLLRLQRKETLLRRKRGHTLDKPTYKVAGAISGASGHNVYSNEMAHYDALSYEWGDLRGPAHRIILNGQSFRVRENLFQALLCLRSIGVVEPIWVDAICINQEDIHERNHQVRIMNSIYRRARRVRVWIGHDTRGISDAFQLIQSIMTAYSEREVKEMEDRGQWYRIQHSGVDSAVNHERPSSSKNLTSGREDMFLAQDNTDIWNLDFLKSTLTHIEGWAGLVMLLERSYWTRIWIVQEYLLAQDIIMHCGWETISGRDLDMAFNSILQLKPKQHPEYPSYFKEFIDRINDSTGKKIIESRLHMGKLTLADLIDATRSSKCQDPHDRIYAILGLADDASGFYRSIPIDYNTPIFKLKMDIAWSFQELAGTRRAYMSRICSLLDEVFADYPDSD